jgi:hypothetical protein
MLELQFLFKSFHKLRSDFFHNLSEQAVSMHYLIKCKWKTRSCNADIQLNAPLFNFVCNREQSLQSLLSGKCRRPRSKSLRGFMVNVKRTFSIQLAPTLFKTRHKMAESTSCSAQLQFWFLTREISLNILIQISVPHTFFLPTAHQILTMVRESTPQNFALRKADRKQHVATKMRIL